eukprot:TRINITY_DN8131_c0_g1_i1.p1 TRINITY_DN8131_c0_g1~~TRINITY_DN8131_c0_g1_i1.p1  ORF type:complete len:343 (-),score=45.32 TRINITY_DN8131_c0_g1_i1:61-1056(-)
MLASRLQLFVLCAYFSQAILNTGVDFTLWNNVLQSSVHKDSQDQSHIDYNLVNQSSDFWTVLSQLKTANTSVLTDHDDWYAFWINVYNALAVKTVITNPCKKDLFGSCGPLNSITQIGEQQPSLLVNVWGRNAGEVAGRSWSLDDVENMMRSPDTNSFIKMPFKIDPRLHVCIVCASLSCPNLRAEAYDPDKLSFQMEDQMREFLNNTEKGLVLDKTSNTVTISHIFKWFGSDFSKNGSLSVLLYLTQWMDTETSSYIHNNKDVISIKYLSYNWDLNGSVKDLCDVKSRLCVPWWGLLIGGIGLVLVIVSFGFLIVKYTSKRNNYETVNAD